MLTLCWSVKGGSGTTVVAAALAVLAAERAGEALLVDLAGDSPAALGMAEPAGPGVGDWLRAPPAVGCEAISRLLVPVSNGLSLLPSGERASPPASRWEALAAALGRVGRPTVVDAGSHAAPDALRLRAGADLLVIRGCYMALRRAVTLGRRPSGIVLVGEPGRSLGRAEVEHAAGAPVVAQVDWDPNVARAVDAGLLAGRLPRSLRAPLEAVAWAA